MIARSGFGKLFEQFLVAVGVKQGSVLTLNLFTFYLATVMKFVCDETDLIHKGIARITD